MPNIPDCCTVDCLNNGTNVCVFHLYDKEIISFICDDCNASLEKSIDKNNVINLRISTYPIESHLEELLRERLEN